MLRDLPRLLPVLVVYACCVNAQCPSDCNNGDFSYTALTPGGGPTGVLARPYWTNIVSPYYVTNAEPLYAVCEAVPPGSQLKVTVPAIAPGSAGDAFVWIAHGDPPSTCPNVQTESEYAPVARVAVAASGASFTFPLPASMVESQPVYFGLTAPQGEGLTFGPSYGFVWNYLEMPSGIQLDEIICATDRCGPVCTGASSACGARDGFTATCNGDVCEYAPGLGQGGSTSAGQFFRDNAAFIAAGLTLAVIGFAGTLFVLGRRRNLGAAGDSARKAPLPYQPGGENKVMKTSFGSSQNSQTSEDTERSRPSAKSGKSGKSGKPGKSGGPGNGRRPSAGRRNRSETAPVRRKGSKGRRGAAAAPEASTENPQQSRAQSMYSAISLDAPATADNASVAPQLGPDDDFEPSGGRAVSMFTLASPEEIKQAERRPSKSRRPSKGRKGSRGKLPAGAGAIATTRPIADFVDDSDLRSAGLSVNSEAAPFMPDDGKPLSP